MHIIQWNVPIVNRPTDLTIPHHGASKLGQDLGVAVVDGLADQGNIPILYILAESYRWCSFPMLN